MSRVAELESLIKKYSQSYYSGGGEVADEYFDSLVDELRELDPNSEVLKKTGWGYVPEGRKVPHLYNLHVGSLSKVKSIESIPERFLSGRQRLRISAKLDGLSIVTYYRDGELVLAVTRGNGTEGLDVTDKIRKMCPQVCKLPNSSHFSGAIRGEVVMPMSVWDSEYREYREQNPSANPRNFASGVMNRKELSPDLENLKYVTYKVLEDEGNVITPTSDIVATEVFLKSNGFDVAPCAYYDDPSLVDELGMETLIEMFRDQYPCDGLVLSLMEEGLTYDEIAYKFQAESALVTVTEVTWSPTRTGRMAPRVWFDVVELSGAMVRKATGFNAKFIEDNKIGVGAVIEVCRSGEVIPHIMRVVTPADEVCLPEYCPNCSTELLWSGDDLVCETENDSQLPYRFLTVISPVEGAGYSLYSQIIESFGLVSFGALDNFLSTYTRTDPCKMVKSTDDLIEELVEGGMTGTVTKSKAHEILQGLLRDVDPVTFLVACNIKGISWKTAEAIMEHYPNYIVQLMHCDVDYAKLRSVPGIGSRTAEVLLRMEPRIQTLASRLYITYPEKKEKKDVQFKVAITGALSIKRADFDAKLAEVGIEQSSNFKEIKYLITNNPDSTSSKMRKAKENGVEVISEKDFTSLYLQER